MPTTDSTTVAGEKHAQQASAPSRYGALARYLGIRFLLIIPTAWILVTVVFFLMRVIGDPITAVLYFPRSAFIPVSNFRRSVVLPVP